MSAEYAPAAIMGVYQSAHDQAPDLGLEFSGIVGDSAHVYGYHRARAVLPSSDYSVQLDDDKMGDPWAASALDLKPKNTTGMVAITKRLIAAVESKDPRIALCVREFFGTVDGRNVTGRDVRSGRVVSSDSSHLWHVHISIIRRYANDAKALAGIADVIAGLPPNTDQPFGGVMAFYKDRAEFEATLATIAEAAAEKAINVRLLADPQHPHGLPNNPGVDLRAVAAAVLLPDPPKQAK